MIKTLLPYMVRFFIGGLAVAGISVVAKLSPHISGLLAAFPAVFLTALILIRFSDGHGKSIDFAQGGIHGVIGTLLTALATLTGLMLHLPWFMAILFGMVAYCAYVAYVAARKPQSPRSASAVKS